MYYMNGDVCGKEKLITMEETFELAAYKSKALQYLP
jgi:hypothetical protein